MAGDVGKYTDLITSGFASAQKFVDMVGVTCQPAADLVNLYATIPSSVYDVDYAESTQLDVIGQWVGISRYLSEPLTGVYFSFDIAGLGFDQGVWLGPYDPISGLVALPDEFYRLLIKARILNNHWNGSINDAYTLMSSIFAPLGYTFLLGDHSDLTMSVGLVGPPPTALILAMLQSGLFDIRPTGVLVDIYYYGEGPIFAFDLGAFPFGGFDTGNWAILL